MRVMGIDPGIATCGFAITENDVPIHWGGFFGKSMDRLDLRVIQLATRLRFIAEVWRVDAIVTEQFFLPKGKFAAKMGLPTYQRGALDIITNMAFWHMPHLKVHPGHLKIFATGKGNAPKERTAKTKPGEISVMEGLQDTFSGDMERLILTIDRTKDVGHIIEALALARIGWLAWDDQWVGRDLPARETRVMRMMKTDNASWVLPVSPVPVPLLDVSRIGDDVDEDG